MNSQHMNRLRWGSNTILIDPLSSGPTMSRVNSPSRNDRKSRLVVATTRFTSANDYPIVYQLTSFIWPWYSKAPFLTHAHQVKGNPLHPHRSESHRHILFEILYVHILYLDNSCDIYSIQVNLCHTDTWKSVPSRLDFGKLV